MECVPKGAVSDKHPPDVAGVGMPDAYVVGGPAGPPDQHSGIVIDFARIGPFAEHMLPKDKLGATCRPAGVGDAVEDLLSIRQLRTA